MISTWTRRLCTCRKFARLGSGEIVVGPTKSPAGVRTVALPGLLLDDLRERLDTFVGPDGEALIFTCDKGAIRMREDWCTAVSWPDAVRRAGLPAGFHFHDLRHTGNHLAAASGAGCRKTYWSG